MIKTLGILFLMGFVVSGGVAEAATYYVATTGSDARACGTSQTTTTPKQTINNAVGCLSPGDTLLVRGGTYVEGLINTVPSGTSWSSKVRIAAYPGETVWLAPGSGSSVVIDFYTTQQYIEFDGINLDARGTQAGTCVDIELYSGGNPHHIRFQNAEWIVSGDGVPNQGTNASGFGARAKAQVAGIGANEFLNLTIHQLNGDVGDFSYAFYIQSNDNVIDHCNIYGMSGAGIQVYNGYGIRATNNTVSNNTIHDITLTPDTRVWGIVASNDTATKIINNVIYGMGGSQGAGIYLLGGLGTLVYNNTVYNGSIEGIVMEPSASSVSVMNNIAYANKGGDYRDSGSGNAQSNNLLGSNPSFVNAGASDFHLQAGSPAIGSGATIAMVATDIGGLTRVAPYDIGAYKNGAATTAPAAPTNFHVVGN